MWTPEFLRMLADEPHLYAEEIGKILFNLADAIENSMSFRSMQEALEQSKEPTND